MTEHEVPIQVRSDWLKLPTVPIEIAEAAFVEYLRRYGTRQSFERFHEWGGFEVVELMQLLVDRIRRLQKGQNENESTDESDFVVVDADGNEHRVSRKGKVITWTELAEVFGGNEE